MNDFLTRHGWVEINPGQWVAPGQPRNTWKPLEKAAAICSADRLARRAQGYGKCRSGYFQLGDPDLYVGFASWAW